MALPCGRGFCQTHARSVCCAGATTTAHAAHTTATARHRSHVLTRAFDVDRELIRKTLRGRVRDFSPNGAAHLMKDEGGRMKDEREPSLHPSSFRLHPFSLVTDAAASLSALESARPSAAILRAALSTASWATWPAWPLSHSHFIWCGAAAASSRSHHSWFDLRRKRPDIVSTT